MTRLSFQDSESCEINPVAGCIIGGAGGYYLGSTAGGYVYDWAEGTFFTPLPEIRQP